MPRQTTMMRCDAVLSRWSCLVLWCLWQAVLGLLRQRQGEPEGGALARRTPHPNLPTVSLDDRLADVQADPDPDTGAALDADSFRSVKAAPDRHLLGGGHADARITHRHARGRAFHPQAHYDRAVRRGVFEGVAQVVGHHLLDTTGIGEHQRRLGVRLARFPFAPQLIIFEARDFLPDNDE